MNCISGRTGAKVAYTAGQARHWVRGELADRSRRDGDERPGLRPPQKLATVVGGGDFDQIGEQFFGYFQEVGGLHPGARVLDVGCGVGRMAMPLTAYLEEGSYAGFDTHRRMIRWCQRHITPQWPDFEFTWADVYSAKYNPSGRLAATEFAFPYADSSFDFAFATSVFTHLLKGDARHYLGELGRVLRPGGACFLTFYLLTPEAEGAIAAGRADFSFDHRIDGGRSESRCRPEQAVAYPEQDVSALLAEVGLRVRDVRHGVWSRTPGARTEQDIVVAERV